MVQSAICHSSLVIQGASDDVTYKAAEDPVPSGFFEQNGKLDNQMVTIDPIANSRHVTFAISATSAPSRLRRTLSSGLSDT